MRKVLLILSVLICPVVSYGQYIVPSINAAVPYFSEEPQFNDLGMTWLEILQLVDGVINRQHVFVIAIGHGQIVGQQDAFEFSTALVTMLAARVIHKNAAHHPSANGIEVSGSLPVDPFLTDHPHD